MKNKTALYRHFDKHGRLLYVGISLSAVNRLIQHKQSKWSEAIVSVEYFDTRQEADMAETKAIASESPLYNIAKVPKKQSNELRNESYDNPYRHFDCQKLSDVFKDSGALSFLDFAKSGAALHCLDV